jgi:hypothetical protein
LSISAATGLEGFSAEDTRYDAVLLSSSKQLS